MDREPTENLIDELISLRKLCQQTAEAIGPTYEFIKGVELSDMIEDLVQQSKKCVKQCLEQWRDQVPLKQIERIYEKAHDLIQAASLKDRIVRFWQADAELAIEHLGKASEMFEEASMTLKKEEKHDQQSVISDKSLKIAYEFFVQGNQHFVHVADIIENPFLEPVQDKGKGMKEFAHVLEKKLHRNYLHFIQQMSVSIKTIQKLFQQSECIQRIETLLQESHINENVEKQSPRDEKCNLLDCCKEASDIKHHMLRACRYKKFLEHLGNKDQRHVDISECGMETVLLHVVLINRSQEQGGYAHLNSKPTESGFKVSESDMEKAKKYIFHPIIVEGVVTCAACSSELTCWETIYELPSGRIYDETCFHNKMQKESACATYGDNFKNGGDVKSASHCDASLL